MEEENDHGSNDGAGAVEVPLEDSKQMMESETSAGGSYLAPLPPPRPSAGATGNRRRSSAFSDRPDHLRSLLRRNQKKIMYSSLQLNLDIENNKAFKRYSLPTDLGDDATIQSAAAAAKAASLGDSILSSSVTAGVEDDQAAAASSSKQDFSSLELPQHSQMDERIKFMTELALKRKLEFPVEVRINDLHFEVPYDPASDKIQTVYNSSIIYKIARWYQNWYYGRKNRGNEPQDADNNIPTTQTILDHVNLVLKPGCQYLILGAPGSGKSTLLKAIAGLLPTPNVKKGINITGTVTYNGKSMQDKQKYHIENAVAYIDQLDRHAPRYTVKETFEFAWQCKTGGVDPAEDIVKKNAESTDAGSRALAEETKQHMQSDLYMSRVDMGLEMLGLAHVGDTFVGDDNVRGVSGGQRRRVTVGEMIMDRTPILCGDEISTGLDAASTFDMIELMTYYGRMNMSCRAIALLQPSPETVSLFDEVIVLAEGGKTLYSGPLVSVIDYFKSLGYCPPDQMDVADFLQVMTTPDAANLWDALEGSNQTKPYTIQELADAFRYSQQYQTILEDLKAPLDHVWDASDIPNSSGDGGKNEKALAHRDSRVAVGLTTWAGIQKKYANSFPRSAWLNLKRCMVLWVRDRRVLIANFIKNAVMGVSVGGVFWQTEDAISILGVLFQSMLFILLGASTAAPAIVDDRVIFQKQFHANFFSAYPWVMGRTMSQMPQTLMDVMVFGTILYFMVGLHTSFENYAIFIAILFTFAILVAQIMAVFAAAASTKASVQLISSILLLLGILFGGFIVPPSAIPSYYKWIYWMNPFAWAYRALILLEFRSGDWGDKATQDALLRSVGFVYGKDNEDVFGKEWVGFWFAFMAPIFLACAIFTAFNLQQIGVRKTGGGGKAGKNKDKTTGDGDDAGDGDEEENVQIDFIPATLTFENICYDVQASTGKEMLRLLTNVDGIFEAGRMCALMGSSGAGKTTLMDVIALRKSSGNISGEIRINGFPQEKLSFQRSSGYVEQFDVQSPELTVRETILYSARLRLDPTQLDTDVKKCAFVDSLMKTLELYRFSDVLVGVTEEGGLTFEQKKRLSIAVELAASPSIIFLDEPTSGLDARSALLVVRLLRKIASEGRTICATIHQPSLAVFDMFDDLLLLKKGGKVVFFGELGEDSSNLINYFESRGAKPIERGENPANWVLTAMSSESRDYGEEYLSSSEYKATKERLTACKDNSDPKKKITYETQFAASSSARRNLTNKRLMTIYWRSPGYSLSRMTVSAVIAIIMGSIIIGERDAKSFTETEMRAQFAVFFLSFIIIGIMSIFSVLPVMMSIRDMFYRHRAAGMLGSPSLAWALGYAEKGFILFASIIFCLLFLGIALDWGHNPGGRVAFWGFFTFNMALYSYFGQAFVCLFKPMATAQILSSVFIGLNNFFSGLIVRPQYMTGLFAITYWITPGHYVYEGMIASIFRNDNRTVIADYGTEFFTELGCNLNDTDTQCSGTVDQYMDTFFGGKFREEHIMRNCLILGAYLVIARLSTWLALHYINYSST